ncbi:prolyl-tRNA synthetase associated domain-containing protein [Kaistia geumhonensis]|uniref:Ala-tRNA(Pro) deacylase n=1 Tax=Kaistia geumhonensis TaxID=410839 RepID=A0ABU0M7V8_9HYPH|nr:prolyl-tRNA synthetase associated domain-containing protein [Kaistia geumhonensis]MCX5477748.1 prolyl-tRNA synthetase associated domain-containing protein [Kaistia geumhonensis]MDQ0517041.1 Ala-tRNA(Pro) deacylase [Kaistia geumhonensis]
MPMTRHDLLAFLETLGIRTETVEHPPLFTVAEGKELRGALRGLHSKNLFVKDKKGRLFLVVAVEDSVIDLKRLHELIGASGRLSFGSAELLLEVLGVTPGSVTPFALVNDAPPRVTLVLDRRIAEGEEANFHPLVNTATTRIAVADLLAFAKATGHPPLVVAFGAPEGDADL